MLDYRIAGGGALGLGGASAAAGGGSPRPGQAPGQTATTEKAVTRWLLRLLRLASRRAHAMSQITAAAQAAAAATAWRTQPAGQGRARPSGSC
jgi:hypothetical protein